MQLIVSSTSGAPFRVTIAPADDIITLTSAVARRARLKPDLIRLSHAGRLLENRSTISSLGLVDGDSLMVHVRAGQKIASVEAPNEPFGADTIGFFINIVTAAGRAFFRPKVAPADDVGKVLDAAVARARSTGVGGQPRPRGVGSAYPQLRFRGRALKRGRTVQWHGIAAGDELVLHLDAPNGAADPPASRVEKKSTAGGGAPVRLTSSASSSLHGASDADVYAAADLVYDAFSREVKTLRQSNRRLRQELRYELEEGDDGCYDWNGNDLMLDGTENYRPTSGPRPAHGHDSASTISSRIREAFDKHDPKHSGKLGHKDLRKALEHCSISLQPKPIAKVLKPYDDKPSGTLDLIEFDRLVRAIELLPGHVRSASSSRTPSRAQPPAAGKKPKSSASATFARFDVNDSGYLDYTELRAALGHYGLDVSTHGAQEILAAYDDTPDGKLDKAEWAELVKDIEAEEPAASHHQPHEGAHPLPMAHMTNLPQAYRQSPVVVIDSTRTPVGAQYESWTSNRWSRQRRSREAAALRTLDRELRDEAVREDLLTEELENEELDELEREDELTQQLVDELEAEILDEEAAADELIDAIELDDDPYEGVHFAGYHNYAGFGEPAYAHGYGHGLLDDLHEIVRVCDRSSMLPMALSLTAARSAAR